MRVQPLQESIHLRDAMAAQIHFKRDYHKTAIQLNRIDLNNLVRHATTHNNRTLVVSYTHATGFAREQQAFTIATQVISLYTHLKAANIDTTQLNREASQYVKRNLLKDLPQDVRLEQRANFDKVAQYLSLSQLIARDWKTYGLAAERSKEKDFEESNSLNYVAHRRHVMSIEQMSQQRDQLAYELFQGKPESQTIQTALQFYQIGEAQHWNGQPVTSEDNHRAKKRLDQLQAASSRHERLLTVQHYMNAVTSKEPSRLKVAQTILDNPKIYHGSIVALNSDKIAQQALWRMIRQDAKRYQWEKNFKSLTHDERLIYLEVQRYAEAKHSHAMAWREVFEARDGKSMGPLSDAQIHQLMQTPHPYTTLRNQLADNLMKSPALYESALEDAGLSLDELKKQAYTNQCETKVTAYLEAKTRLQRAEIAVDLIQDPKAHWPAMRRAAIDWKQVYNDVNLLERKQTFARFSLEEKQLYRATLKYRQANITMGKLYGELKLISWKERTLEQNKKLSQAALKRDKLAYSLMEQAKLFSPNDFQAFSSSERLKLDKLVQQSEKYRQHLTMVQKPAENEINSPRHDEKRTFNNVIPFKQKQPQIDLVRLREDLNKKAESIALHYLGQPKKRVRHQWRYGSKNGSLFVTVSGSKQGLWNDFQAGVGGDMFKLIQESTGLDFKGTLKESLSFLGGESHYQQAEITPEERSRREQKAIETQKTTLEEKEKVRQHVAEIVQGLKPIQGTLAELYLRDHRHIQQPLNSQNLYFHPNLENWMSKDRLPALVVVARDNEQNITGIQATFLNPTTGNKAKLGEKNEYTKLSRGTIGQGSIVHQAITDNPKPIIALAEGLETALSVASARPDWEVRLTFGVSNFEKTAENVAKCRRNVPFHDSQQPLSNQAVTSVDVVDSNHAIIICADNDGENSGTAKAVKKAVENLSQKNITVTIVEPEKPASIEKWDFNDALKKDGVATLQRKLTSFEDSLNEKGKEEHYKEKLRHYQSLRKTADQESDLPSVFELQDYAEKLSEDPTLMAYTKKNYSPVADNIEKLAKDKKEEMAKIQLTLTPEKQEEYNKVLRHYQTLQKDLTDNFSEDKQDKLTAFTYRMVHNETLMHYTQYFYPPIAHNVIRYAHIHAHNQTIERTKEKNQDIDR